MSDNNNNNNQQQKFNSVFAYWDGKDKRVQQSKVLLPHIRKPVAKVINVNSNNPTTTTSTTTTAANTNIPQNQPVQSVTQPTQTSLDQVVPSTNVVQSNNNEVVSVVEESKPVESTSSTSNGYDNVKKEETTSTEISTETSTETSTPKPKSGYENVEVKPVIETLQSPDTNNSNNNNNSNSNNNYGYDNVMKRSIDVSSGSSIQEDLVVGESSEVSVSTPVSGYANYTPHSTPVKSQYDNFGKSETPRELTADEQAEQIVRDAERDQMEMSRISASTYGSVYGGSMYTTSYGYGGDTTDDPYAIEDDEPEEDRCDISESALLHLESLCHENAYADLVYSESDRLDTESNTPSAEVSAPAARVTSNNYQLLPSPSNYYISTSAAPSGYSHPKFLTNKENLREKSVTDESLTSWNSEFQRILEMDDSLEKFERLASLEHDFVYAAESYGRIIISEHLLPDELKTIKPVSVGGIAGGEKYIVQGILFKFAVESDTYGLYGSDENAMKTAAHELNGCTSFLNCGIKGLHVPLMSYIDYRGFRLMALSLLPITKKTLVYGSSDAGQTVYTANTMFNHLFGSAAKVLNLKSHRVQDSSGDLKTIQGPIDIEGHVGTDGRFYLLDFARLSPPEPPIHRGAYLYRLLRLELVRTFTTPLCSDAFSPMSTISVENHNAEVKEAYDFLMTTIIPKLAITLDVKDSQAIEKMEFSKIFHSEGVNMRQIGQVRQYAQNEMVRRYLMTEALVRCLKSLTRELLRREMKKTHLPSDYPYRRVMVNFLNLIFGEGQATKTFWDQILKPKLEKKFKGIFNLPPKGVIELPVDRKMTFEKDTDLKSFLERGSTRTVLLKRFTASIGLVLSKQSKSEFYVSDSVTFVDPDIIEMRTQITRLNIIDYADGMSLYFKSQQLKKENNARNRLLSISKSRLEQSLHSMSTNYAAIFQLGNVIRLMARLDLNRKEDTYILAENTYLSLEKLRIDQNLLYQSKLFRAKTMLSRIPIAYHKKEVLVTCIDVLNEALGLTSNKCEATYYIAKAKKLLFDNNLPHQTQEEFDEIINHLESLLKEEPNNAKANFRLGEYSASCPKFNKKSPEEVSNYYNLAITEDNSLINKIEPTIKHTVWLFFPMTRSSPKLFDLVKTELSQLAKIAIPEQFQVLESDYPLFDSVGEQVKFSLLNAKEDSIRSIIRILKFKPNNLNLMKTAFQPQSPVFTDFINLTSLTSINLGRCTGVADYVIDTLATVNLKKLRFHNTEGITDTSIKTLAEKAPNLEVLDAGSCDVITGEHFSTLVASCPNIRKLALPKKVGFEAVQNCLHNLKKLVALDLLECEEIPNTFYSAAFKQSESIIKIRSTIGFPHFQLSRQNLTHMVTRHIHNEGMITLGGQSIPLMRSTITANHFFHQRAIHVFFYINHPLVKFRDYNTVERGSSWVKVGQMTIVEKPVFKITVHKLLRSSNTWDHEFNVPVPTIGFGPTSVFNVGYYGNTLKFNFGTVAVHGGIGYSLTMFNEAGTKVIFATNQRTLKLSSHFEIYEAVPSHWMYLVLSLSQMNVTLQ
ncbi:hypothetical protein PPL_00531 [Heterostelium album PN500]|uniref:Clu domain-containing protein n=1 Tax=Heterostelium pallidum (strain ATCC 26659 / Pp 5 / PN500) TaxID=670386 RepID=D3AWQ3_HETP5|nr:hypothetical protein PPL_00531 [Heterostelium album PN500]EFA86726.1 hypothetical protein PPL_00531 [Heterostelium album PN500]|eukprot:XP_020438830.1 hypothetical protein PPL_00531 [Heterostelium album PN500]